MWSKISNALKPREGNDSDLDHSDTQSTASHPPDPFCANATAYYAQTMPPMHPPRVHSRTASCEEDIISSLRTQLALQQELCTQFEIDLSARDELVEALTTRLEASEQEQAQRKSVVRSWKKKAADLEKMCRRLEEELDDSRQETVGRSIMDEASGEALRQLHRRISQLEREKSDVEAERNSLARTVENAEAEVARLEEELGSNDGISGEAARQLYLQISQLNAADEDNREGLRQLHDQVSQLQQEKGDVETERDNFSSEISRLRVHIQQLQKDSAVMEVTIVQLNKQLEQEQEDVGGLNIALESKQQELELVKRKHGARGTIGLPSGRTSTAPSSIPPGIPSALGRAANTKPRATTALRRASTSTVESKTKLPSRKVNTMSPPGEADGKENTLTRAPLKNLRRTMVPA